MKPLRNFGIFFIILLALGSCQKELIPSNFLIGSGEGVSIILIENSITESCYGQEKVIELDVDNNGRPDLKFFTYAIDSLGDQDRRGSSVWSLEGCIEFGYKIAYEELYSVKVNLDKVQREVIYNERSHFYCPDGQNLGRRDDRSTFSSPVLLKEGSKLSKEIKWSDKLQILSHLDQSRQFSKEVDNTQIYNNILTGVWDEGDVGYLPFRIKSWFNSYQYGWIKLRVIDHRRIEFFEIGLQNEIPE